MLSLLSVGLGGGGSVFLHAHYDTFFFTKPEASSSAYKYYIYDKYLEGVSEK